jgi:hypothetical protein
MQLFKGTLTVRTRTGRNGAFNVGKLSTDVGTFVVKEAMLDELDPGTYTGQFVVSKIYATSYCYEERSVTEIRVSLESMNLDEIGELSEPVEHEVTDIDPLEEERLAKAVKVLEVQETEEADNDASLIAEEVDEVNEEDDPDKVLFGMLYPLGATVKLDPSNHAGIRKQAPRLKALGYRYNPKTQTWHKAAEE